MWLEMTSSLPTTFFGEELQFIPPSREKSLEVDGFGTKSFHLKKSMVK